MAAEASQGHSNLTLCDYFAVIGFDKSRGLQVDKFAELASDLVASSSGVSTEITKSPLDCSYEAKVLCHFPDHRKGFPFVSEISSLCMPKGLRLYTERKVPKDPNFHSFVLVREDGTRVNGCALIFYEPLMDTEIRQQIYDLQMEQIRKMAAATNTSSENLDHSNSETPPAIPRHTQQHPPGTVSSGNHTLPRKLSSKRSSRSSVERDSSTESPRRQRRPRNYSAQSRKRISFYDSATKPIYISKCICFVTRAPIVYSVENLLRSIYAILKNKFSYFSSLVLPLESLIFWALHEVPLPLPNTCLKVSYGECNLMVKHLSYSDLPFFDYPIQILFSYISIERFIKLFTCFMLEHQILLCSKYMDRLMLVAECLSVLIFPFRWQLTYVPILPYSQIKFIEAPVPYLMGLCYDDKIPDQIFQSNVCIFDIDSGRLDYPEDIPPFPRQRQIFEQILQIQQKFHAQSKSTVTEKDLTKNGVVLRRHARSSSKPYGDSGDAQKEQTSKMRRQNDLWSSKRMSRSFDNNISFEENSVCDDPHTELEDNSNKKSESEIPKELKEGEFMKQETYDDETIKSFMHSESHNAYLNGLKFNHSIRELFLCHFASLFASYEHFLIGANNGETVDAKMNRESIVNFDKASFLSDQPESYLPFLAAFLETQMFTSFVDTKILSHCKPQSEESRYLSYFDKKIQFLLSIVGNDTCTTYSSNQSPAVGSHRTPVTERPLDFLFMSPSFLQHQSKNMEAEIVVTADYEVEAPHPLIFPLPDDKPELEDANNIGIFPDLNPKLFEVRSRRSISSESGAIASPWKQQHRKQRVLNVLESATSLLTPSNIAENSSELSTDSPMRMAHQNWRFVEQLLKETKTKTKRMLVAKMGKEAVHLGHGDLGITGVEENTLVAAFCDLLERIWAHGLKKKQGKSALWTNIFAHHDREKFENFKLVDRYSNLSPELHKNDKATLTPFSDNVVAINSTKNSLFGEDNSKTLNDLLDSIRSIARSIELVPIDGINENADRNNLQQKKDVNSTMTWRNLNAAVTNRVMERNKTTALKNNNIKMPGLRQPNSTNQKSSNGGSNWLGSIRSASLARAANFIADKIDKIATAELSHQVAPKKHLSTNSAFGDDPETENDQRFQRIIQGASTTEEIRRGRSTDRRSTTNSDISSSPHERKRDESKPKFYHHEDIYSKKLRHVSRQRRDAAAARAAENNNILKDNLNKNLESPALPPPSPRKTSNLSTGALIISQIDDNDDTMKKSDVTRPMRKSSSVSDFAPHWSSKKVVGNEFSIEIGSNLPASDCQTLDRSRVRNSANREARKRSLSRSRGVFTGRGSDVGQSFDAERNLPPLPTHMAYDLKNVMKMTEIKTDIGFARAFVRLALERKLLHKHLKAVLSDTHLLQSMYKRYAFLRCEEEREQFLYHVLSLNAVDFSCFTHTFISTKMSYQVLLVASIDRFSSSSIWIMLTGSLGSTSNIYLPSNSLQFTLDYKNLGVLSTLRIGHSAGEKGAYPSKWFLEYVLARNNITGQTFCFNCNRWFGRGVDDGALERLLVAENFYSDPLATELDAEMESFEFFKFSAKNSNNNSVSGFGGNTIGTFGFNNFISRPESPVSSVASLLPQKSNSNFYYSTGSLTRRRRSPSVGRSTDYVNIKQTAPKISELQHKLGMSVNALVKHFFTEKDYHSGARLTPLLCGENGLVGYLEQVFELGRQDTLFSNRFFRQPYPWDYIERVFSWFANFFRNGESRKLTREQRSLIIYAYNLVVKISANTAVGKEGKFHIFILLTLRDHILSGLLPLMAWTPVTAQIYDDSAFLRQPHHLTYLSKLLNSLNEFNFTLEKSLIYGIEL